MSDEMLDLLQYIAQEIIRGILRKQRMRYGISLTKIGKCFSTMIGQSDFEKLKETIHKPNSRQRSSPATSLKTFVQSVPDIRCRRGKYSIKRGSKESTKMIVENLSIEEYRQNLLSQVICLLLDNFDVNNRGQNNNTVLHLIVSLPIESQEAYNFQIDLFKALIKAKPDCSAKNDQDMTALHIIAGNYLLDSQKGFVLSDRRGLSCKENTNGRYAKMKCLEDLIKKPFLDRGLGGNSILHEWIIYCVRFNNLSDTEVSIGEWIIDVSEVLPDVVNDLGCTPLHYAFTNKLVDFMLRTGSATDRKNVYGDTPLICIIKGTLFQSLPNKTTLDGKEIKETFANHAGIPFQYLNHLTLTNENSKRNIIDINVFLDNDFNLMVTDGNNKSCLYYLLLSITFLSRHSMVIPGSMELIGNLIDKWIIELASRDVTAMKEETLSTLVVVFFELGTTPQQLTATILSHVENLLKDGADPNKTRFDDLDPVLHYCCKRVLSDPFQLQLLKILCEYGADKTSKDHFRRTLDKVLKSDPCSEDILRVLRDTKLKPRVAMDIQSIRYKSKLEGLCCQPNPKRIGDCRLDSEIIGKGAMSCIYLSIDEKCKREMALKRMEKHFFDKEIKSEIEALKKLEQNQNIVNFYYLLEVEDFYYLAIELMDGDLTVLVNEKASFLANPDKCRKLSADIVNGLAFLHQHNMLHRDIKPGNVLYRERPELSLKLADFGLTKHLDDCSVNQTSVFTSTSLCGTRGWMAPELVKRTQNTHTRESDMYALGLLLHFLFSKGFHPFHSSTEKLLNAISTGSFKAYELETNISQGKGSIRKDLTPEQNHLVRCLLSDDPKKRPTSKGLIQHHCYFWSNLKKVKFMWTIGDQPEVAKPSICPNSTFGMNLQITRFGLEVMTDRWSLKIPSLFQEISARGRGHIDTNSVLGLIRFFRNAYAHYEERSPDRKDELLNDHFFKTFPEFFVTVWMEVYNQGWMIASGNKLMLMRVIEEMD